MSASSDVAILRNPNNGGHNFQWAGGDVVFDDTLEHEVASRLAEKRAQWAADDDGTHGSRLHQITHINSSTLDDANAFAREALAPMAGRLTVEDVQPQIVNSRVVVEVFYRPRGAGPARTAKVTV